MVDSSFVKSTVGTSSSKVGRLLDGGSVECALIRPYQFRGQLLIRKSFLSVRVALGIGGCFLYPAVSKNRLLYEKSLDTFIATMDVESVDFSSPHACDDIDSDNRGFPDRVCMCPRCHVFFPGNDRQIKTTARATSFRETVPLQKSKSSRRSYATIVLVIL